MWQAQKLVFTGCTFLHCEGRTVNVHKAELTGAALVTLVLPSYAHCLRSLWTLGSEI